MQETSPRTDLCNIVDGDTVGSFDESTGNYSFKSQDFVGYPEGVYIFEVTTVAGAVTLVDTFEMSLSNPCAGITLTIEAPIPD